MTERSLAKAGPFPAPQPGRITRGSAVSNTTGMFAVYLTVALLLRAVTFGNPVVQIDVQFYALVGERMLSGALPYVDIWDRKPVGLFVLFAGLEWFGKALRVAGPLPYQLAATASAAATALVIERIARTIASRRAAFLAGLAYLPWLLVFNCADAQTPVFYNLPMALAALATLRACRVRQDQHLLRSGHGAMLLVGLAMQLKTSVVFKGIGFGLALLARGYADGLPPRLLIRAGTVWILAALAPILLAFGFYAAIGRAPAFIDAAFLSIFRRHDDGSSVLTDLLTTCALLVPFAVVILRRWRHIDASRRAAYLLLAGWALVAIAGYLAFGTYYDHYAAPLLLPLCVLAAPALDALPAVVLLVGAGLAIGAAMTLGNLHTRGNGAELEAMAAQIRPRLMHGCLYVYEGDPALYQATLSCLAGRYVFPSHIDSAVESHTIDQRAELGKVLARRPAVIVTANHPLDSQPSLETRAILRHALAENYHRFGEASVGTRHYWLYARAR